MTHHGEVCDLFALIRFFSDLALPPLLAESLSLPPATSSSCAPSLTASWAPIRQSDPICRQRSKSCQVSSIMFIWPRVTPYSRACLCQLKSTAPWRASSRDRSVSSKIAAISIATIAFWHLGGMPGIGGTSSTGMSSLSLDASTLCVALTPHHHDNRMLIFPGCPWNCLVQSSPSTSADCRSSWLVVAARRLSL